MVAIHETKRNDIVAVGMPSGSRDKEAKEAEGRENYKYEIQKITIIL